MPSELTPREYSTAYQARRIIDELSCPGLSADTSLDMIRKGELSRLQSARFALDWAQWQAENNDPAEPDEGDGILPFCDYCGATAPPGGLADDSLVPLTGERIADPAWTCADLGGCLGRRRIRYPPKNQEQVRAAKAELALAADQARPAILALIALTLAQEQQQAQAERDALQAMADVLGPGLPAQRRLAPLYGEAHRRAKWAHTLMNPANRAAYLR